MKANSVLPSWCLAILGVGVLVHLAAIGLILAMPRGLSPAFLGTLVAVVALEIALLGLAFWKIQSYWPGILVVIGIKVCGLLATSAFVASGVSELSREWPTILFDLAWIVALGVVVRALFRPLPAVRPAPSFSDAVRESRDQSGQSLVDLSQSAPVLVVFLRHFGCTFCREALHDLATKRAEIEKHGVQLAVVHMGTDDEAEYVLGKYQLADIHRVRDPLQRLYSAFELRRGTWGQLLGWKVLRRGMQAAIVEGHGVGKLMADSFQMPGVFLLWKGRVQAEYRHKTAADRPDYIDIASCVSCPSVA
jgi:peroxiredoxin